MNCKHCSANSLFLFCAAFLGTASIALGANNIPIVNPSFEADVLTCAAGASCSTADVTSSWTGHSYAPAGYTGFGGWGVLEPSAAQSATITFTAYNTAGSNLGTQSATLGPLQHSAANIGPLLGLFNFTGFVKITSTIPIISLSLNAEAFPVFSSLPPGDLPAGTVIVP